MKKYFFLSTTQGIFYFLFVVMCLPLKAVYGKRAEFMSAQAVRASDEDSESERLLKVLDRMFACLNKIKSPSQQMNNMLTVFENYDEITTAPEFWQAPSSAKEGVKETDCGPGGIYCMCGGSSGAYG